MRTGVREEDKGHAFFSLLYFPPFFIPFRESARCRMDGGAPRVGFRVAGVERVLRIMMDTDLLGGAVVAGALEAESKERLISCS